MTVKRFLIKSLEIFEGRTKKIGTHCLHEIVKGFASIIDPWHQP